MPSAIDPARCPLCGRPNHCQRVSSEPYRRPCWCFAQEVPSELLRKVPVELQGLSCVCQACVDEHRAAEAQRLHPTVAKPGDFYFEHGLVVFNASYLLRRGYCCQSGCRHCPYPKAADTSPAEPRFDP